MYILSFFHLLSGFEAEVCRFANTWRVRNRALKPGDLHLVRTDYGGGSITPTKKPGKSTLFQ
jgi:hypothetical protein